MNESSGNDDASPKLLNTSKQKAIDASEWEFMQKQREENRQTGCYQNDEDAAYPKTDIVITIGRCITVRIRFS